MKQYTYLCLDNECPVVVFVDSVESEKSKNKGVCPNDKHELNDGSPVQLIEKDF